jgi:hypothetical protein
MVVNTLKRDKHHRGLSFKNKESFYERPVVYSSCCFFARETS